MQTPFRQEHAGQAFFFVCHHPTSTVELNLPGAEAGILRLACVHGTQAEKLAIHVANVCLRKVRELLRLRGSAHDGSLLVLRE